MTSARPFSLGGLLLMLGDGEMEDLKLETVKATSTMRVMRARTNGGWIVVVTDKQKAPCGVTYVPDRSGAWLKSTD